MNRIRSFCNEIIASLNPLIRVAEYSLFLWIAYWSWTIYNPSCIEIPEFVNFGFILPALCAAFGGRLALNRGKRGASLIELVGLFVVAYGPFIIFFVALSCPSHHGWGWSDYWHHRDSAYWRQ